MILYKMKLEAHEDGLRVVTEEWHVFRETPCFYYCLRDHTKEGEKRIAKVNSRFAFKTKEEAYEHLVMLKRRQLRHMERETVFLRRFLTQGVDDNMNVPDSREMVHRYINFD